MTEYSVAEAKARFSELLDKAEKGQSVVITRHGKAVVEFKPAGAARQPGPITKADLDWLAERRKGLKPAKVDAATLLSKMRDEDWK